MIHFKLNDRFIIIIISSYTDHDHVLVERCQSFNSVSRNWEFFDLNLVQHQRYFPNIPIKRLAKMDVEIRVLKIGR